MRSWADAINCGGPFTETLPRLQECKCISAGITKSHATALHTSFFVHLSGYFSCVSPNALQRKSYLSIFFLGIARPQSQFPHSCVCERFIYS
jgi:hypothetical protein